MTGNDASGAPTGQGYGATLWEPDAKTIENARISRYMRWLAQRGLGPGAQGGMAAGGPEAAVAGGNVGPAAAYQALWEWSVEQPGEFWTSIWDYFEVLGDRGEGPALTSGTMPDVHWFPGTTLNYAQNALRTAWTDPDRTAVVFSSERDAGGSLSYAELAAEVARVAAGLRSLGVRRGDRVAALLPNIPEAVIGLLAAASIGAIWSSCSPDFGTRSVVDRFAQIEPTVLIAVDGYQYGGKEFPRGDVVAEIAGQLPSLAGVVMVDLLGTAETRPPAVRPGVRVLAWAALGGNTRPADRAPEFEQVPFEHPLWVVYSSGTTGLPKPIVHGHGGIVLEHLKALALHLDLHPGDRFTWYTTTGWMMWNFQVGGLLAGTTIVLYDGSATYPETGKLWRLAADEKISYFGVGAPYLTASQKAGLRPGEEYDLSALRAIGSTGSPLPPEGFSWVYEAVRKDLLLGSLSGGTDVCTGFVGPCPLLPVRSGVISSRCLGAKVEAFGEDGTSVVGKVGELVVTRPMPSMPVMFWNDPDGTRYTDSYFAEFPGVWRHGDWIEILPDGGCVIYGRSDATLNRGGVRMGTSEFYRVVESFDEVADSLVVDTGRLGESGMLILYVALASDVGHSPGGERTLSEELAGRIRAALRKQLSPRHVPDEIIRVPGIPRTLSGKKLEIPVRKILLGTPVAEAADPSALANPEVLGYFGPGSRL
jgi:acetoacetyl-CoA synthetase